MKEILIRHAVHAAVEHSTVEQIRRFLRALVLWTMGLSMVGATIAAFDPPSGAGTMLEVFGSHFIVLCLVLAVPVLVILVLKWIIFG